MSHDKHFNESSLNENGDDVYDEGNMKPKAIPNTKKRVDSGGHSGDIGSKHPKLKQPSRRGSGSRPATVSGVTPNLGLHTRDNSTSNPNLSFRRNDGFESNVVNAVIQQHQMQELLRQSTELQAKAAIQRTVNELVATRNSIEKQILLSRLMGNDQSLDIQRRLGLEGLGLSTQVPTSLPSNVTIPRLRELQDLIEGDSDVSVLSSLLAERLRNQHQLDLLGSYARNTIDNHNYLSLQDMLSQARGFDLSNLNTYRNAALSLNSIASRHSLMNDFGLAASNIQTMQDQGSLSSHRYTQANTNINLGDNATAVLQQLCDRYALNGSRGDLLTQILESNASNAQPVSDHAYGAPEKKRPAKDEEDIGSPEDVNRAAAAHTLLTVQSSLDQKQGDGSKIRGAAASSTKITVPMDVSTDADHLSKYQVLIRLQLEYFVSEEEDAAYSVQGRKKEVRVGQVGIRCKHCSHLPHRLRGRGAGYYPAKLYGVYQAAQNMATNHLNQFCNCIPSDTREKLRSLRGGRHDSAAGGGKQYWANKCNEIGLIEYDDGVYFRTFFSHGNNSLPPSEVVKTIK